MSSNIYNPSKFAPQPHPKNKPPRLPKKTYPKGSAIDRRPPVTKRPTLPPAAEPRSKSPLMRRKMQDEKLRKAKVDEFQSAVQDSSARSTADVRSPSLAGR